MVNGATMPMAEVFEEAERLEQDRVVRMVRRLKQDACEHADGLMRAGDEPKISLALKYSTTEETERGHPLDITVTVKVDAKRHKD